MSLKLPYFVLLLVANFFSLFLTGQYEGLRFKHLSVENGLSQNSVRCLLQDSRGFMWFGTEEGLNKYDGYRFHVYQNIAEDTTSLSANDIRSVLEDRSGFIWVGTTDGLNVFDPKQNSFLRIQLPIEENHSAKRHFIYSLFEDQDGDIWIGTSDGFYLYRSKERIFQFFEKLNSHPIQQVMSFYQDHNKDKIWIGSEVGLFRFDKKTGLVNKYSFKKGLQFPCLGVSSILEDQQGKLWVGTFGGLYKGEQIDQGEPSRNSYAFKLVIPTPTNFYSSRNMIRCMVPSDDGRIWIGTFDGLLILDPVQETFWGYQHQEGMSGSLSANFVRSITKDKRGDIWIGTIIGGINVFHYNYSGFEHPLSDWASIKMKGKIVHSFSEDKKGNLWVSTRDGGVSYIDRIQREITNYVHEPDNPNSLVINEVRQILVDSSGLVWMATYFGGVNRFNPGSGKFRKYLHDPANPYSIGVDNHNAILQDRYGNIWIGTHGAGLALYDPKRDGFIHLKHDPGITNSLSGNIIVSLFEDSDGNLWIGTRHSGLNRMDLKTRNIIRFRHSDANPGSISSDAITAIYQDSQGLIWVGTEDAGLNKYNPERKNFKNYRKSNGLPSDAIHGILEDNGCTLWLSTNNGLSHFSPQTEDFINYDHTDGLRSNQFSRIACFKTSKKELLFGGINGFTVFCPDKVYENLYVPPVYITDFKLFNKDVPIHQKDTPLKQHISFTNSITLKNHQSVFSFGFIALNYLNTPRNRYAYKMEGLDDKWNYVGNKRSVDFTTLPPGAYTFRVRASNNSGVWNKQGTSIKVRVLPPWYRANWAFTVYALVFIGLLILYRYYSLLRIKEKHNLKLARIEKERIEEINHIKLQFFTDISHELRTPLSLILGPLEKLSQFANGNSKMTNYLSIARTNADYLLKLINELLEFRRTEVGKMKINLESTDLIVILDEVRKAFQQSAITNRIHFTLCSDLQEAPGNFDIGFIKKALYNLLANAFDFTPKDGSGIITMRLSTHSEAKNHFYRIDICDNGPGIPESEQSRIFDPFYQGGNKGLKVDKGSGIGLALTKRLIDMHGGQISLKSKSGCGSEFTINLPAQSLEHRFVSSNYKKSIFEKEYAGFLNGETICSNEAIQCDLNSVPIVNYEEKKPLILLVEDNASMRRYIVNCLDDQFEIIEAANGETGCNLAKQNHPDLIISDVMMPIMDGLELCKTLKNNILTSHIPIIFLTAKTSIEHRIQGLMTGVDSYLTKPFSHHHLQAAIDNLLFNRQQLWKAYREGNFLQKKNDLLSPIDQQFIDQLEATVIKNLKESNFSVSQLAKEMTISRSYFHRKLKAITGLSASGFITEMRLKKSVKLLADNKLTISEIAYEVGFSSPNYFGRCFRKKYGVSPSEYKDQPITVNTALGWITPGN